MVTLGIEENHGIFYYEWRLNKTIPWFLWKLQYINGKHTIEAKKLE